MRHPELTELSEELRLQLNEVARAAREGLFAMSVAVGPAGDDRDDASVGGARRPAGQGEGLPRARDGGRQRGGLDTYPRLRRQGQPPRPGDPVGVVSVGVGHAATDIVA